MDGERLIALAIMIHSAIYLLDLYLAYFKDEDEEEAR